MTTEREGVTVEYMTPFMVVVIYMDSDGIVVSRMICGSGPLPVISDTKGGKNVTARNTMPMTMSVGITFIFVKNPSRDGGVVSILLEGL